MHTVVGILAAIGVVAIIVLVVMAIIKIGDFVSDVKLNREMVQRRLDYAKDDYNENRQSIANCLTRIRALEAVVHKKPEEPPKPATQEPTTNP